MSEFFLSFLSFVRNFFASILYCSTVLGGALFGWLTIYDIFCPIGKEIIYFSEEFRQEKKSLRWNRKK